MSKLRPQPKRRPRKYEVLAPATRKFTFSNNFYMKVYRTGGWRCEGKAMARKDAKLWFTTPEHLVGSKSLYLDSPRMSGAYRTWGDC